MSGLAAPWMRAVRHDQALVVVGHDGGALGVLERVDLLRATQGHPCTHGH